MATTTITDLPMSRALDYKAMSAIKGAGGALWCIGAFRAFMPESARIAPVINFYQTNFIADNLTLQFLNVNVENSAPNSTINVDADQNALSFNFAPVFPQP